MMPKRRPLKDAAVEDMRAAVYNEGPLRHLYMKEPGEFVLELCERIAEKAQVNLVASAMGVSVENLEAELSQSSTHSNVAKREEMAMLELVDSDLNFAKLREMTQKELAAYLRVGDKESDDERG